MADNDTQTDVNTDTDAATDTSSAPDLASFVPESFKKEDDSFDLEGFRADYDRLTSEAAQREEALSGLPEDPSGYEFALPEDFELPEGFDAESLSHVDEDGNKVEFDPASMLNADDPDLPQLQSLMHELGQGNVSPVDAMKKIAGLMATRELRGVMDAQKEAQEAMEKLGPQGKSRVDTVTRSIKSKIPGPQAQALLDGITSADALRGFEALLKKSAGSETPSAPGGVSMADLSIDERLELGLKQRSQKKSA